MTFKELNLNESLLSGLDSMGFETATPIQEQAIPEILKGNDLIACAQTGTGKTAAFLLPILHDLTENPSNEANTLIIVPTRELAIQIDHQLEGLAYFTGINFAVIYGGRDKNDFTLEKKALTSGVNVIVATPGRLITHLNLGYVQFGTVKRLILDEADRMLDMGFFKDIMKIVNHLPSKDRQTLMFSATMPTKIKKLAQKILNKPSFINLKVSKPAEGILQGKYYVKEQQKVPLIVHLLNRKGRKEKLSLIFSSTKASVKKITAALQKSGIQAEEIHSDLEQNQRSEVLQGFKSGKVPVLVATDILSRGIDVKGINLVINYNVPSDEEDYIHRIGRTARANLKGTALTLINRKEGSKFRRIEEKVKLKVFKFSVPESIEEQAPKSGAKSRSKSSHRRKKRR